jgi:hypothetical protein
LLKAKCRRSDSVARRPHTASAAGHLVPAEAFARLVFSTAIQATDLKTATSSFAAEMPPQSEVNSLNINLVAR